MDEFSSDGDDERRSFDDVAPGAVERCGEIGVTGACDEPADLHCPSCRRPLCYACAGDHCNREAPACRPPTSEAAA